MTISLFDSIRVLLLEHDRRLAADMQSSGGGGGGELVAEDVSDIEQKKYFHPFTIWHN